MPKQSSSAIIGGMGVAMSLVTSIVKEVQRRGGTDEDIHRLVTPDGVVALGKIADLVVENGKHSSIIDLDAAPFVPSGWKVEEHIRGGQLEWDSAKVALFLSEGQQNGKVIQGNQLREELKGRPVYNANLLDYLLAHPELIPESWKGKHICFWGTICRASVGRLCVRYLYWDGYRWDWDYLWLDNDFDDDSPAAVGASSS